MISSVINPKGNRRDDQFSRCEEYIFFIYFGNARISSNGTDMLRPRDDIKAGDKSIRLRALLRQASNHGKRTDRPNLFIRCSLKKKPENSLGMDLFFR